MDAMDIIINTLLGAGGGYALKYINRNEQSSGLWSKLIAGAAGGNLLTLVVSLASHYLSDGGVTGFTIMSLLLPLLGGAGGAFINGLLQKQA